MTLHFKGLDKFLRFKQCYINNDFLHNAVCQDMKLLEQNKYNTLKDRLDSHQIPYKLRQNSEKKNLHTNKTRKADRPMKKF